MILRSVIIASILVLQASATQSPPPAPAPPKTAHEIQQPRGGNSQDTQRNDSDADQPSSTVNQIESVQSRVEPDDASAHPSQPSAPDWIGRFTGALVFIAVAQLLVYALQARLMAKGLAITKQSADAATSSAKTARDALVLGERAYIGLGKFECRLNIGKYPRIEYTIKNTGKTPAKILNCEHGFMIGNALPEVPHYPDESDSAPSDIGADQTMTIIPDISTVTSKEEADKLLAKTVTVFFWARISYEDIFGDAHLLAFANQLDHSTGIFNVHRSKQYNYSN